MILEVEVETLFSGRRDICSKLLQHNQKINNIFSLLLLLFSFLSRTEKKKLFDKVDDIANLRSNSRVSNSRTKSYSNFEAKSRFRTTDMDIESFK